MNTLTCAELTVYPGQTPTERLRAHYDERGLGPTPAAPAAVPAPVRQPAGRAALPRQIDVRRFPGKTRIERVANYLRAYMPRAESWGEEAVMDFAARLVLTARIVD